MYVSSSGSKCRQVGFRGILPPADPRAGPPFAVLVNKGHAIGQLHFGAFQEQVDWPEKRIGVLAVFIVCTVDEFVEVPVGKAGDARAFQRGDRLRIEARVLGAKRIRFQIERQRLGEFL